MTGKLQSKMSIDDLVAVGRAALDDGRREEAVAAARAALVDAPDHIAALRCLADALTSYSLYRFDAAFAQRLAEDGALAEAIALRRRLAALGFDDWENELQIGYCLTALGNFDEAATHIRRATDLFHPDPGKASADEDGAVMRPDFFIIGSAKCGTTSLFEYISEHPSVLPPVLKEIDYFLYPQRGIDWFLAHFPRRPADGQAFVTGEASVSTLSLAAAPAQVLEMNPAARLIALARDPVDRAVSHYANNLRLGVEKRSLAEAIGAELDILEGSSPTRDDDYWRTQQGYLWIGLYANDLERWFAAVPPDQIAILLTEELEADHERVMERVFGFLGLPPHPVAGFERHNKGVYDTQDQRDIRDRMAAFFARPNERFFELIGRRLAWSGSAPDTMPFVPAASTARILFAQRRWAEAAEAFAKCLQEAPAHWERQDWLELRSKALLNARDLAAARASVADLLEEFPEAEWAASGLVRVAELANDPAETVRVLEDCLRRFPGHAGERAWLLSLGRALFDMRRWERAGQVFQIIVSAYPDEPLGVFGLAKVADEHGETAHAIALFDIYARRFPADPDRRWWLVIFAHVLLRQNMLERAAQVISAFLADFPDDPGGLACRALLEQKQGNSAKAVATWNDCLARYPDHPDRKWWLPTLTNLLIERRELDHADALIDEMLIAYPKQPGGLVSLARVAALRNESGRAAEIWEECLARFPGNAERRWWLPTYGHALLNLRQVEAGEQQFRTALAEFPDDPVAKAGLARAMGARGQWPDAARLLADCLGNHPGHANASEWENMLRNAKAHLAKHGA